MTRNLLHDATSPYLLQHKDNPVHWMPWGDAAFERARTEDKPILLSVGYAACHWCHVMAHESFENERIAELMNRWFISVKVDREERPDVDRYYMKALHLMGQQGGWPLTMFVSPDGRPLWGGTYFPPEPRYGRPSFPQVLEEVARLWRDDRDKLLNNARVLSEALAEKAVASTTELPPDFPARAAYALADMFDPRQGGLRGAPKFPQCPLLELLLCAGRAHERELVISTLTHISQGGIYDHLGGGFARYSTDERWLVPHFEKMLYDNAQLIAVLARAHALTGEPLFRRRIEETITFLKRDMLIDNAGFASSFDADSEGEEGRFYVWSYQELSERLDAEERQLF
ncbi:MAG TPA: thioredoxin domain-containing protein, partial [Thermopetrobacter sp.]|nr:thioredoxin domain-containing protein [Thermopetrobacter sp.]